jgi:BirA family biotin operon repressor/biotin-[acetyl-CoA-carboxylase] ligase
VERPAVAFAEFMDRAPPSPDDALEVLASAFERWRAVWDAQGFAPIARAWTERAHGLGAPCEARLPNQTHRGVAEGLDPDGALRLRLADGAILRITAGDVFFGAS